MPAAAMRWEVEGADWPNRDCSRFVAAAGIRWHVQIAGSGPCLLLVHGTGAATHSWRDLLPLLAQSFTVVAPDLPGHGFTAAMPAGRATLPGMAAALAALLLAVGQRPTVGVGHSAGAAILVRLCLDQRLPLQSIVSLNGALLPMQGMHWLLFAPAARLLATNSLLPRLVAWRATDRRAIARLVASTGSVLDQRGVDLYARVAGNRAHVAGALAMMANWDLASLQRDLPRLQVPLTLVAASNDSTVPPTEARRAAALLPRAQVVALPGLGHLAHEEEPAQLAQLIGARSPLPAALIQ